MWLIRKQVTWPITRCFNEYDSDSGKQFGQTPCSLSRRLSKESYCRPHPGSLSRKRVIALLSPFFSITVVSGEETVPGSVWRRRSTGFISKVDQHQHYLQPFTTSCISLPPSLSVLGRVLVPRSSHKDCRLSGHPFHNQAGMVSFLLLTTDFLNTQTAYKGQK